MHQCRILSHAKCLQSPLPCVLLFPGLELSSSPSPFSLAICTAPSSLLCEGQGSAGVEAITGKAR